MGQPVAHSTGRWEAKEVPTIREMAIDSVLNAGAGARGRSCGKRQPRLTSQYQVNTSAPAAKATANVVRTAEFVVEGLLGRGRSRLIFADDPAAATGWPHSGQANDCPSLSSGTRTVDPQTEQVRAGIGGPRIRSLCGGIAGVDTHDCKRRRARPPTKTIGWRRLNSDQKRRVIAAKLRKDPEKSNRQIAEEVGVDHKTVASEREDLESIGQIDQSKSRKKKDGGTYPAKPKRQKTPASKAAARRRSTAASSRSRSRMSVSSREWAYGEKTGPRLSTGRNRRFRSTVASCVRAAWKTLEEYASRKKVAGTKTRACRRAGPRPQRTREATRSYAACRE
jgi:hypothetical protein